MWLSTVSLYTFILEGDDVPILLLLISFINERIAEELGQINI